MRLRIEQGWTGMSVKIVSRRSSLVCVTNQLICTGIGKGEKVVYEWIALARETQEIGDLFDNARGIWNIHPSANMHTYLKFPPRTWNVQIEGFFIEAMLVARGSHCSSHKACIAPSLSPCMFKRSGTCSASGDKHLTS